MSLVKTLRKEELFISGWRRMPHLHAHWELFLLDLGEVVLRLRVL